MSYTQISTQVSPKKQRAFTLIELMVTLAVAAILVAIAAPSFKLTIDSNKTISAAEDLAGALNFARSEAVKRSAFVTVCAVNSDGTGCAKDWSLGWIAVLDTAATATAAAPVVDSPQAILKRWDPPKSDMQIILTPPTGFVRFVNLGLLAKVGGVQSQNIKISTNGCVSSSQYRRTLSINSTGLVQVVKEQCSAP